MNCQRLKRSLLFRIAPYIKNDVTYIKWRWKVYMDYPLHLEDPKSFNEKLQWLKLHDRQPIYSKLVDKYEVKQHVANIIGEEHIIPTIGIYDSVEDIDFDSLPQQYVLKCTHDSGGIIVCKDKSTLDRDASIRKLQRGLKKNYYYQNREWPYKNIKPRIIAEQYMNNDGQELDDYKVHNFNGEPKVILVCSDRFKESGLTEDFYSCEWQHLDVSRPGLPHSKEVQEKPVELDEMLVLAKKLSKNIPFVRTDFYIINHQIYFGEMTFFPACGSKPFVPREWDYKFGSYLTLPK